jgi:hypothetical protein
VKPYTRFFEIRQPGDLMFLQSEILSKGTPVAPRGKPTMEIRNIVVKFEPTCDFILSHASEKDIVGISAEARKFYIDDKKFADMRVTHILNKVEFEMNKTIDLLLDHPTTRRARILEADYHPMNIACIQSTVFFRRNGALEATVMLRSSDIVDVLKLDVYATQRLQDHILATKADKKVPAFNLPRGPVTALIASAHTYL